MKRFTVTLILSLFIMIVPIQAFAATIVKEYIPPAESDYYKKKYTLWISFNNSNVKDIRLRQIINEKNGINYSAHFSSRNTVNDLLVFDYYCQGPRLEFSFMDAYGNVVDTLTYDRQGLVENHISGCTSSHFYSLTTDYDYDEKKYKDDTFGESPDPGDTEEPEVPTDPEPNPGQSNGLSNVLDWDFFWGMFGFFLRIVAPFVMLIVAILAVGILLTNVIAAVKNDKT